MLRCALQLAALFLGGTVIRSEAADLVLTVLSAVFVLGVTLELYMGIMDAQAAAGLELREEPFGCGELPRIDELFFADHRGITALARCDGQPLMSLIAERIALVMEGLFPKK